MTGFIRPELAHLAVPIGEVRQFPGNPRRGDHDRIATSLRRHGQYAPLLVQSSTGRVVKGNNTLQVMTALGYSEVAVVRLDIDDERARNLLLIDNRLTDEADYDLPELTDMLAGIIDWEAAGWTPEDLDDMLAELDHDAALSELEGYEPDPAPQPVSVDLNRPPARIPPTRPVPSGPGPAHPPAPPTATRPPAPPPRAPAPAPAPAPVPVQRPVLAELLLYLPPDDRAEAMRLIAAARDWLGADLTPGEVVLRALRTLAAIGDARHNPHHTLKIGTLLYAAGRDPLETS
ncbi:hypothetical protein [Micromonospora sp. WMMC273]|uniref:hypothetical protein n=1 Tax=Micromonospora sp. WMMC273 TaxID=3015157 RepID=UPI0022B75115|nr:hypothetical protein [Micromonospora sp. WMMC273]MCZ7478929.1 hypothetical protein [Micromonospora sp. WMMC273]MCZ7478990.1 hypothetical protein [Micromonospora sp. WMMC273]